LRRNREIALMLLLGFIATAIGVMEIIPKFGEVFRQVRVPMPSLTLMALSFSDFCRAHPVLVALLMTGVPASAHVWSDRAVAVARPVIPFLFLWTWGWMAYSMFLPLMSCHLGIGPKR
jgi:type II secretory pathway component PulF